MFLSCTHCIILEDPYVKTNWQIAVKWLNTEIEGVYMFCTCMCFGSGGSF